MAAQIINRNFFPLGLIAPTPGSPVDIFQNFSALRTSKEIYANFILFQAKQNNAGAAFIGQDNLNVASNLGINYILVVGGDSFSISTQAGLNVFSLLEYRIDVEQLGDGVFVSLYVR